MGMILGQYWDNRLDISSGHLCHIAIENSTGEIVSFPSQNCDFPKEIVILPKGSIGL